METKAWKDYELSRMMLGTVQFGLPYGVANRTGQPSYGEVRAIVAAAIWATIADTSSSVAVSSSASAMALSTSPVLT